MSAASPSPSAAQLAAYGSKPAARPVVLFYELRCAADTGIVLLDGLRRLAARHRGRLFWAGEQQQVLIGPLPLYTHCAALHFASREAALRCVREARHAELLASAAQAQVAVVGAQKRTLRLATWLMSKLLPRLSSDDRVEDGPEPGMGSSIMPGEAAMAAFVAHPEPRRPIVMVNWLRFRPQARYALPGFEAVSGQTAYYRYGQVAFRVLHGLGARAFFLSRYQQILIGNGGDPGLGLWHDFALVEYPGRATFKHMASLRRYRAALHHRAAGLDEQGQGLVVTVPLSF